jgi:hypothetical protein
MIDRITNIMNTSKNQLSSHGYTRYNDQLQPKSHYKIEKKKSDQNILAHN